MEDKHINQPISELTEDYSNTTSRIDMGGRSNKKFVRINKVFFQGLVDAIRSGDSSYVTYINDSILDGYMLQYVSTMQKDINKWTFYIDKNAYSDVAGSRVANMLGIKTCYNCLYSEVDENGKKKPKKLLSVDFLKNNEKLIESCILAGASHDFNTCWDWISKIDYLIENSDKYLKNIDVKKYLPQLHDDLVEQFLLHKCVLGDSDYCGRNIAIITDEKKGTMFLSPSYDYDLCLNSSDEIDIDYILDNNMRGALYRYPQAINSFMEKLKKFNPEKLREQLSREIDDIDFINTFLTRLSTNIQKIFDCYACYTQTENIR